MLNWDGKWRKNIFKLHSINPHYSIDIPTPKISSTYSTHHYNISCSFHYSIHKLPSWNYSYIIHFSNFYLLNKVIGAATQCALSTSQLVACAKVVAPTISDPLCQEQLMEAAKDVAKSVEGCVTTCKDVSRDEPSLRELGSSAQDVTRALNDLLNHVKDGHTDKIPDIMEVCEKLCFSFSVKSISRIFVSFFSLFEIIFTNN